ncbi:MAG: hypothetical protein FWH04_04000 [Oscillospiraceae bacterium]|nr:hypothetical protein [Oscillospiraceae bacterium]
MLSLTLVLALLCSMLPSRATDPPEPGGYVEITTVTYTATYYPDNMRRSKITPMTAYKIA